MGPTTNKVAKVKYKYNINWNHVLYIKGDGRYSSTVAFVNGTTIQIAPDEMTYDELEQEMNAAY